MGIIESLECLTPHLLCLDLTGAQDGSVRMFEWTRPQQLVCFRQAGNARVTRLYFNSQGNKVRSWELVVHAKDEILIKTLSKVLMTLGLNWAVSLLDSVYVAFFLTVETKIHKT